MMAVGKLVIVDHDTRCAFAGDVIIAAFLDRWRVYIGQVFINHLVDAVCAAEGADDAVFGERVFLLSAVGSP